MSQKNSSQFSTGPDSRLRMRTKVVFPGSKMMRLSKIGAKSGSNHFKNMPLKL